jgi:hypothetical protein
LLSGAEFEKQWYLHPSLLENQLVVLCPDEFFKSLDHWDQVLLSRLCAIAWLWNSDMLGKALDLLNLEYQLGLLLLN